MPGEAMPTKRRRFPLKWALYAAMGSWLAWRVVTLGIADQYAQELDDPAAALAWDADHPGALLEQGLRERAQDPVAAIAHLRAAIAANPADGRAYAVLGRLLEMRGDAGAARTAMETAARITPQRSDVQREVAAYWMRQGDVGRALGHWNVALAHRPDLYSQMFPALLLLAGDPARHADFLALLKQPVTWWPAFFTYAAGHAPGLDTVRVLFNLQQGGPNAATPDMLRAYLARLQKDGAWLEAWFGWLNSLPKEQVGKLGYLFNGGFEQPISNLGFDWIVNKNPAVSVDALSTYDASGERALRVGFRGLRVRFRNVYQYLMLPPGDYALLGRARPDNLQAVQGMQWALYCLGTNQPVAVSERFRGNEPWKRFRTGFSVPETGCAVQMLRLELAGTIGLDFDATGTIWFDDLSIHRIVE